jgi:uncharacterized protein (DUF1015 family)
MELTPVTGHVVAAEHASAVIAPPYDALTQAEREAIVAEEPDRFLQVLPSGAADADGLLANRAALERLLATGRFVPLPGPSLAVLGLRTGDRTTIAVLGDLPASAYARAVVRPHEQVRPERVTDLVRHLEVVGIASSPVCVVHAPNEEVTAATAAVRARPADLATELPDTTELTLWLITDAAEQRRLARAVADAGPLTVADGHHRAAAAADHGGPQGRVLTAAVPADHLEVLAFHRRLDGLGPVTVDQVLEALASRGLAAEPVAGTGGEPGPGVAHLAVADRWLRVPLPEPAGHDDPAVSDPVAHLDVSRAEHHLLPALVGLAADPDGVEVVPVPAPAGPCALHRAGSVGLALHAPAIDELLAVAAAGATMPRKSTYLVPKLRSGVLVVPRGDTGPAEEPAPRI